MSEYKNLYKFMKNLYINLDGSGRRHSRSSDEESEELEMSTTGKRSRIFDKDQTLDDYIQQHQVSIPTVEEQPEHEFSPKNLLLLKVNDTIYIRASESTSYCRGTIINVTFEEEQLKQQEGTQPPKLVSSRKRILKYTIKYTDGEEKKTNTYTIDDLMILYPIDENGLLYKLPIYSVDSQHYIYDKSLYPDAKIIDIDKIHKDKYRSFGNESRFCYYEDTTYPFAKNNVIQPINVTTENNKIIDGICRYYYSLQQHYSKIPVIHK